MVRHVVFEFAADPLCCGTFISETAFAQQSLYGTPAEAKAMFEKAIAALKADKAKAIEMFNKEDGGFRDHDLYVFCFDAKTGIFNAQVVKSSKVSSAPTSDWRRKRMVPPWGRRFSMRSRKEVSIPCSTIFPDRAAMSPSRRSRL